MIHFTIVMRWSIETAGHLSIHDQLVSQVIAAVATGELSPDERLAPAGDVADALGVNVNTVLGAYRRLRDLGVLEFRRGRSVRVRARAEDLARLREVSTTLRTLSESLGYDVELAVELLRSEAS